MMIPYFIVLFILAAYGLHRYWLVYDYYVYRKNVPARRPPVKNWPKVTVQLPIFNERYVIERLVDAVSQFDYPRELIDIQVLDDSTDETCQVARACVERHAAQGMPILLHPSHQSRRLQSWRARKRTKDRAPANSSPFSTPILFPPPIFSAAPFPISSIPMAVKKSAWSRRAGRYLNRDYSLLTRVETILLDGHFVIEHGARSRRGTFFNFNGTAGVWRRTAIDDPRRLAA